jgi:hypothetical protein
MAKIHEEIIIIKISKLVKNEQSADTLANDEVIEALAGVAEELCGAGVIVEVEKAQ